MNERRSFFMSKMYPCLSGWLFSRDGNDWTPVTLPHAVFREPEEITDPQIGKAVYRYEFDVPADWASFVPYFEIGAAMQRTEVYLNGSYHFTHFGGYQRFFIPLGDYLKYGEKNVLELRLDNAPSHDVPPGKSVKTLDYCYHSGLHRGAFLHLWNPVHITDPLAVSVTAGGGIFIRTEQLNVETGEAELSLSCHVLHEFPAIRRFDLKDVYEESNDVQIKMVIRAPDGKTVAEQVSPAVEIRPNCDNTFRFSVKLNSVQPWSPVSPALYTAEFYVFFQGRETDCRTERFGIRTISFDYSGFRLNGKRIVLNGTNRHSEYPFIGNAAPSNAQKRDVITLLKAGYNFVRLSHYTQDPAFLDMCDETGMLVMPAIPGWQAFHANSAFYENAFRDCREMIRDLRNRPSVILWEVSLNESYPPIWINEEFHRIAHQEYPGEQCYSAGDTWGYYEGWDVLFPCARQRNHDKPMLLREYGDWTFGGPNSTSRRLRDASVKEQLVQAWNFMWNLNCMLATPGMVGGSDWCGIDYNRGCTPKIESSGTFDLYRLPKPVKYQFYRSQGLSEPMVYAIHDEIDKLIVLSNCDSVELFLNGESIKKLQPDNGPDTSYSNNSKASFETALFTCFDTSGGNPFDGGNCRHLPHPPFTFRGIAPLKDGDELLVAGYKNGVRAAETVLRKPGDVSNVETFVRTEGIEPVVNDLVFVDAILRDAKGTVVPVSRKVQLQISGSAEIIGGMTETAAGIASWLVRITGSDYSFSATLD